MAHFRIERLADQVRSNFSCGVEPLDRYFREQVTQDMRRRTTACFVAVDEADDQIAAFYTLSAGAIALTDLPAPLIKRLPRYPSVPVARLGRLAVATSHQGQKLSTALFWDAVERAERPELMAFGLVVDAKDESAVAFYLRHGFVQFGSLPNLLIFALSRKPKD